MSKYIAFLRQRWVIAILATVFVIISFVAFTYYRHSKGQKTSLLGSFVLSASENLRSDDGRTNLVLMGRGGGDHESPLLTDSMVFISINHKTNKVAMLSLPRDIWVPDLNARINTAYEKGEENGKGQGLELSKSVISQTLGVPVHYAIVLDFNGFTKLIDIVGGLDIDVERTFDDYKYPIPGKETAQPVTARYEHLHFDAGPTHMDGELALKYTRSRHAVGDEGTDFARSRRQQKVLLAFKEKLFSTSTLLSPTKIRELVSQLQSSIDTDIASVEYASFLKLFLDVQNSGTTITSGSLEEFLVNPPAGKYNGAWVLVPKTSWEEIRLYVTELME